MRSWGSVISYIAKIEWAGGDGGWDLASDDEAVL